ncbi:hypothetical protein ENUP19_0118G0040 [Entamoeba nuttalli]|uniref:CXXC-rich protein n=1 Tax=Entamoeba nuttalli TaxID=412467 RepID=A0ABQ0DAN6_9EUKA
MMKVFICIILFISLTYAVSCLDNQYVSLTGECQSCSSHCSSCFDAESCQRCEFGYELRKDQSGKFTCNKCGSHCALCSMGVCTQCEDDYAIKDGECEEVIDNSKTVILILGIIVAVVVIAIGADIMISFILKKTVWAQSDKK